MLICNTGVLLVSIGICNTGVINPRHVHAEGYCSCPVCVYVCPLISAASHIGITKERYQRIHRNTRLNLPIFIKMLCSKVMA